MARRVIDSNILMGLWRGDRPSPGRVRSKETARAAALSWLRVAPDDGIITPVRLEFLVGARDRDELDLYDYFLSHFKLLDDGRIIEQDWREAERLARWIPAGGVPRGAMDWLIRAVCNRLRVELKSKDAGVPPGHR